jgi:hypothetical protein
MMRRNFYVSLDSQKVSKHESGILVVGTIIIKKKKKKKRGKEKKKRKKRKEEREWEYG